MTILQKYCHNELLPLFHINGIQKCIVTKIYKKGRFRLKSSFLV